MPTPVWLNTKNFLCFWYDSFELLSSGIYDHVDTSQWKIMERWVLLMLTTDHVVFHEMFVSVAGWSCTNIMCSAACITSILCECFSEYYNLSVEVFSCLTLSLLEHDCLYQAGLLTICYAAVWQEWSSWILCILVLLLIWALQIVMACAASGCTTIGYPLVFSLKRDLF